MSDRPSDRPTQPSLLSRVTFSSRWLPPPLNRGLITTQIVYVFLFAEELLHLVALIRQTVIHGMFLLAAVAIALIDRRMLLPAGIHGKPQTDASNSQ